MIAEQVICTKPATFGACEVVQLRWTVQGIKLKKLLVSMIGCLVVNAGVQPLVIIVIKILGDAGLGVG